MKFIKKFFFILMLVWMGVIFSMSAKPAEESSQMSNSVGFSIGKIFIKDFDELSPEKQLEMVEKMDHTVRKTAHAIEYMLLGMMSIMWLYEQENKRKIRILLAWLICVFYAISDEIHQYFVPGRACRASDVLIDSSGALAGVLFISFLLSRIYLKKAEKVV